MKLGDLRCLLENHYPESPMNEAKEDDGGTGVPDVSLTGDKDDDISSGISAEVEEEDSKNPDNNNDDAGNDNNGDGNDDTGTPSDDGLPDELGNEDEDFSMDSDSASDDGDNSNDDVNTETGEYGDAETNVQYNILELSKLDRHVLKRKLLSKYQDFRTSIQSYRRTVQDNESVIKSELREDILVQLNKLSQQLESYLTTRFVYLNYEESMYDFITFTTRFQEILSLTKVKDGQHNKESKK